MKMKLRNYSAHLYAGSALWSLCLLLTGCLFFGSCESTAGGSVAQEEQIAIIPLPQHLEKGAGHFTLEQDAVIGIPSGENGWNKVATYLAGRIEAASGTALDIQATSEAAIVVHSDDRIESEEGYRLEVNNAQITIAAKSPQGAFYAIQSLLQLMPAEIFSDQPTLQFPLQIPAVNIEDNPRFTYRGMHLDVGRHFFNTEEVKQFLDLMALHKYNTFHWHLTEDQGWRIEIKQYPKLTEVGGFRNQTLVGHFSEQPHQFDGKRYGGYYTQEEVKEIVAYAQDRFITVVPEIELPGHAQAAIAAYPELGCQEEPVEVMTVWGVSENVYCPTEYTFDFIENVIDEVVELFPGEYFHIGGDECPKKQWEESAFCQELMRKEGLENEFELQSYFIRKVEKMLTARGKRLIGWDEILEGGLAPNATVMSWRGMAGGIEAAKEGHDVIMTPTDYCYLDYYQSQNPDEPLAIGGFLPIEKVYQFEPVPEALPAANRQHIIGGQANIWTEYIPDAEQLFYMAYPRASAIAEVLWSAPQQRDFQDFSERLLTHFPRLQAEGIDPADRFFDPTGSITSENGKVQLALSNHVPGSTIRYTLDGREPSAKSDGYSQAIELQETATIKAATFVGEAQKGKSWTGHVQWHKALGKSITLTEQAAEKYGRGGAKALINGVFGSERQFGDPEWLGFEGKPLEATIDLGAEQEVSQVKCRFFEDKGAWIHFPTGLTIDGSKDGNTYTELTKTASIEAENSGKVATISLDLPEGTTARYLKVTAPHQGKIPEDLAGAGFPAWLFAGEIVVE